MKKRPTKTSKPSAEDLKRKAIVESVAASAEQMSVIIDAAATAASNAAPGYEVIVIIANPVNSFRVHWGSMNTDRAGWLLWRSLTAVGKMF